MAEEQTGNASNASKAMGEVEVTFAGEKHTLKYTLWAFCKLDELTGKNPLVGSSWSNITPKDILYLLWAGLLHEKKNLTAEELGEKISLQDIAEIGPKIQVALGIATPNSEDEKKTQSLEDVAS